MLYSYSILFLVLFVVSIQQNGCQDDVGVLGDIAEKTVYKSLKSLSASSTTTLNENSQWKYMFGDEPPSGWNMREFSDSWSVATLSTLPTPTNTSAYYCASFNLTLITQYVSIDYNVTTRGGYAFYVNGIEMRRDNLPSGPLSSTTHSLSQTSSPFSYHASVSYALSNMNVTNNLVCVEIHTQTIDSSNFFSFTMSLNESEDDLIVDGILSYSHPGFDDGIWHEGVSNAVNKNTNDKFFSGYNLIDSHVWIQWSYNNNRAVFINYLRFYAGNKSHRRPHNIDVLGSNDGVIWSILTHQTPTWSSFDGYGENREYRFDNGDSYHMYRIDSYGFDSEGIEMSEVYLGTRYVDHFPILLSSKLSLSITTSTSESSFPIYDPFILGDNTNYEVQETCFEQIIPDIDVLRRYLAVRDAYPTKALKYTRVLALSGMTEPAIQLIRESLSRQELNSSPIDMYFYSDYKIVRYVDATLAIPLISLSEFTRPSRIVFGDGSFRREGLDTVIQWMIDNRNKGYFLNLEYFQVTGHKAASYSISSNTTTLTGNIVSNMNTICKDKVNFPKLTTMNFNSNAYNELNNGFDATLRGACDRSATGVTIRAMQVTTTYPPLCSTTNVENYWYYDMTNSQEVSQCRFTWNWEMGNTIDTYGDGPFPNAGTEYCGNES